MKVDLIESISSTILGAATSPAHRRQGTRTPPSPVAERNFNLISLVIKPLSGSYVNNLPQQRATILIAAIANTSYGLL
nr:MAG TPA: hypothetical protein [Caudoviricetes sp.]